MAKYVNAKQLARRFMSKGKDKMRLSTIINEIEIAEKGLSLEIDAVEVVRCKDCMHKIQFDSRILCSRTAQKTKGAWYGLEATGEMNFCSYGKRKEVRCGVMSKNKPKATHSIFYDGFIGTIFDEEMYEDVKWGRKDWKPHIKSKMTAVTLPIEVFNRLMQMDKATKKGGGDE